MKNFLICIDSDGCAVDSMEIKHRRCFGPCMIEVWHLEKWQDKILNRWNEINLYTRTRGINRFLALEIILTQINDSYMRIDGIDEYQKWCREAKTFSNAAVREQAELTHQPIFEQVLSWSSAVNSRIESIGPEIRPFDGVKDALAQMKQKADIAVVSSANPRAVNDEWTRFGLIEYTDFVMAQDSGTKSAGIRRMIDSGYDSRRTLMIGDAPGDEEAAKENSVLYYPILAGHENESWELLRSEALKRFFGDGYDEDYQNALTAKFHSNLGYSL